MRIGLLSDVHANLPALRSALETLRRRGAEHLLVAGDIVGYGGQPDECVAVVAEAGARCVAGNHDLLVLDRLPPDRFPPVARRSAELTRSLLSADARAFLEALPLRAQEDRILMTHGSLDSPEEYVTGERRAQELLDRLASEATGADTLVLGHTHRQWCVVEGRGVIPARGTVHLPPASRLLNPGSVGQSRQRERRPGARFALYDTGSHEVEFIRVDYDVAASRQALRQHGLPDRCLYAPKRLPEPARRVARRLLRAATGVRNRPHHRSAGMAASSFDSRDPFEHRRP